jgi:hypothetical protein
MKLAMDTQLWNGNRSRVWVGEKEVVTQDIMPGKTVQKLLDENHRLRQDGFNKKAHGRIAARVPMVMLYEWQKEWRQTYRKDWTWKTYLAMKINSRDYAHLRTTHMKI